MSEEKGGNLAPKLLFGVAFLALAGSTGYLVAKRAGTSSAEKVSSAPSGATAGEQSIASLEERTRKDPKDAEGWQMLGWSYFEAGRHAEAANAYRKATQLVPGRAVYWSSLGEAIVMASERDPMPTEAAAAFKKSVELDPKDPRGRYFVAVVKDLAKDHKGAIADWVVLLKDTPKGAPWEADLRRTIEQVGKINKIDVSAELASAAAVQGVTQPAGASVATAPIPGPTRQQMADAAKMPAGQQDMMVQSMVDSLDGKLKKNPANPEGWVMLIRSRVTLGETTKAAEALQSAVKANPGRRDWLIAQAGQLGVELP